MPTNEETKFPTPTPRGGGKSVLKSPSIAIAGNSSFHIARLTHTHTLPPARHTSPLFQPPRSKREKRKFKCDVRGGEMASLVVLGTAGALGDTGAEAVLEALVDVLQVSAAAGAGGLAALGLLAPVDCFH